MIGFGFGFGFAFGFGFGFGLGLAEGERLHLGAVGVELAALLPQEGVREGQGQG